MKVQAVTAAEIDQLLDQQNYVVGPLRPKMVPTTDGGFIKFFYDQPGLHWSTIQPKAKRFASNAQRLKEMGFIAPRIDRLAYCAESGAWLLTYQRLPGEDLRCLDDVENLAALPAYLADLHQKGVYFRGIHLGNVLKTESGYGLIDIAGMTIWPWSLNIWQRLRNVGRFVSFPEDVSLFRDFGVERFCAAYCEAAELAAWQRDWLTRAVLARVSACRC